MCASTNSVTHSNSAALTLRCVCLRLEPSCPESKVAWKQTVISLPCSYSLEWYGLARGQRRSLMQRAQSVWLGETWQSNASSLQRHVLVTASVQIHKGCFTSVWNLTCAEPKISAQITSLHLHLLLNLLLLELLLFFSPATWCFPHLGSILSLFFPFFLSPWHSDMSAQTSESTGVWGILSLLPRKPDLSTEFFKMVILGQVVFISWKRNCEKFWYTSMTLDFSGQKKIPWDDIKPTVCPNVQFQPINSPFWFGYNGFNPFWSFTKEELSETYYVFL